MKKSYDENSQDMLYNIVKTHIMTTMIGSLEILEKELLPMFEDDDELKEGYNRIRTLILDRGHAEIDLFKQEIKSFIIKFNPYYFSILVKGQRHGQQTNSKDQE